MNRIRRNVRHFGRTRPLAVAGIGFMLGAGLLVAQPPAAAQPLPKAQPAAAAALYPPSQTPDHANGVLFSAFYDVNAAVTDIQTVTKDLELQNYAVTTYVGNGTVEDAGLMTCGPANNQLCTATTADDFRAALKGSYGVLFLVGHGSPGELFVERHDTGAECADAVATYEKRAMNPYLKGQLVCPISTGKGNTIKGSTSVKITGGVLGQNNVTDGISGAGIPAGAYITTVAANGKSLTMSKPANKTDNAVALTFTDSSMAITNAGITANFKDANTVVYLNACFGATTYPAFTGRRDFVGYTNCVGMGNASTNAKLFWGRMAACENYKNLLNPPMPLECLGGDHRWATIAIGDKSDYADKANLVYRHRDGLDTDLSPSVKQVLPRAGAVLGLGANDGTVIFDTKMDTTVNTASVVTVTGCGATINNPTWATFASGTNALDFSLQTTAPGTATLTVHAPFARAQLSNSQLDGNQIPMNTDHVGPNQDDYVWKVSCQVKVFIGYADAFHSVPTNFPMPWLGSADVTFEGCHPLASCAYDGGTVRVTNGTAAPITVNSVAVHISTCTYTGWPSVTLAPGHELIVDQLLSGAGNGCTGPKPNHMDTSDIGPGGEKYANNCTRDNITPTVDVTVNGITATYSDAGKVLNTGGFDLGGCPVGTNESHLWTRLW